MQIRSLNDCQGKQLPVKNTFLDYYKTILEKVSFDYYLFNKEYRKAMQMLTPEDAAALNNWVESKRLSA